MPLQYIQHSEIDVSKWDRCVGAAANGLIYGYAWWLDGMAKHWDALVWNDYDAIMPVTWKRKWGIAYLYQPPFTQQLGIFSSQAITLEMQRAFLEALHNKFRFAEIFLNYAHPAGSTVRSNFVLPLQAGYEQLVAGYKTDLIKNLKRAVKLDLTYTHGNVETALNGYVELYGSRMPEMSKDDFRRFRTLCISHPQHLMVRAAIKGRQLLCAALLFKEKSRMYLLHNVTWPAGRTTEANHWLLDRLIAEFAGSGLTLDFEGSDIPGIAHFYKNFGSIDQPYFFCRYNHLPKIIRWLKG